MKEQMDLRKKPLISEGRNPLLSRFLSLTLFDRSTEDNGQLPESGGGGNDSVHLPDDLETHAYVDITLSQYANLPNNLKPLVLKNVVAIDGNLASIIKLPARFASFL